MAGRPLGEWRRLGAPPLGQWDQPNLRHLESPVTRPQRLGPCDQAMSADFDPISIVVPCFNEEGRVDASAFAALLDDDPSLSLIFVDDGSTDATSLIHARLADARPSRIQALSLPENRGKGEAVR